uniref:Vitellogenin n=1 Tax=Ceratitis capitata TaxID=7213 RepID=W8B060_CERCA
MWRLLRPILFLLCIQWGYTHQNPFRDPNFCGNPQCEISSKKFNFVDKVYKYEYTIDLKTEFSGTGNNASSLFLKATVEINFPKPCDGFLRIKDVKLRDALSQNDDEIDNKVDKEINNSNVDDYYGEFTDSSGSDEESEVDTDSSDTHPHSLEIATELKKYLLRFAFNDGTITEICPSAKEKIWTLNFKRGILSTLQNTMLRLDVDFNTTETDIAGECKVKYSLEKVNDVFIKIRKTKNMPTCQKRYSTNSILQSVPYDFRNDKTMWPLLDSSSYCVMTINKKLYQDITCYDQHKFIPFSNNNTGAVTNVVSRLELLSEESDINEKFLNERDEIVERRSNLLFDHTPSAKPTKSEIKLARDLLKEMCALGFPYIQREFINVFTNFLHTIKQLDYEALTQLLARSTSICEKGRNHVLDSLPYAGSSASLQLMRDQLLTNGVSKKMAISWLKSISFLQRPDDETVETIYTIFEFSRTKDEPEYTLCTSAVIHSYCRYNTDCISNMRVKWITEALEREFINIFNSFRGERRLYERMVVILKGLGNIGLLSEHFVEQLQKIIGNEKEMLQLRLESIYTFRRVNCIAHRSFFMDMYTNFFINSEIRIAAYLQTMRCPDYHSITKIKAILQNEAVNQVGSFVWSHLRNLAKSSSPLYVVVQSYLMDEVINEKYKLDFWKFSRNYQQNFFFDEFNFGSTTDSNLIFGTESYLPRMVTLNYTSNLFGNSYNFLELTTRVEGFEQLLLSTINLESWLNEESIFNQKGLKNVMDALNNWVSSMKRSSYDTPSDSPIRSNNSYLNVEANNEQHLKIPVQNDGKCEHKYCRPKRSLEIKDVNEYRSKLRRDIDNLGYKLKYDYNNPKLQFGLRIFGNDLHYYTVNGFPEFYELTNKFNILEKASELLTGKEITFTKSNIFVEASYVAPLMVGLPLSIDLFGASAIDVRAKGNLDKMESSFSGLSFDFNGMIKPTVLVDLIGTMKSDMFYAQSGVKVKSTLYSNSEIGSELNVRGKNAVSLSFTLPQNISEILSVQSELLKITRNGDEPQPGIGSRWSESACTPSWVDAAIGLKMCHNSSIPHLNEYKGKLHPSLLLSGPMNFTFAVTKSDQASKKWTIEYTSTKSENENNSNSSLIFYTPGSTIERSILVNVSTEPEKFNSSIIFTHGVNKASAVCQYIGKTSHRQFGILVNANGMRTLDLNVELRRQQERNVLIYKPKMLLAVNGVNITGSVGSIRINEKNGIAQSDLDISFETRKLQMLIRGIVVQTEVTKSANFTINYRFQANKIESINIEGRLSSSGDKSKIEYAGKMKLRTSAHPKLNFASNVTWRSIQGHTEGILTFNNALNFSDPEYTSVWHLILSRAYSEENIWEGSHSYASFNVVIPRSKVNFKLLLRHEERLKNGSEHNVLAEFHLNPEKNATVLFSILIPRNELLTCDAFFNITVAKFSSCHGHLKFEEKKPKTYMVNFNGTWFTKEFVVIKANYKDRSTSFQALKMIVSSPSFSLITLNAMYRRGQNIVLSNFNVKYGEEPYGAIVKLISQPANMNSTICEVHINLKEKAYWLNSSISTKEPKMLQMELHLDKLRDLYLKSSLVNLVDEKEVSLELNWDMNRDPSQRLLLLADYKKPSNWKHTGQILVSYPDRTISCAVNVFTEGPKYHGDLHASWEINEAITLKYNVGLLPMDNVNHWLHVEIQTPFNNWAMNSIDAGVYNNGNLLLANTSLIWGENQNIKLIWKSDVNMEKIPTLLDIRFGLNSTILEMPSINLEIRNMRDLNKLDSGVSLRYSSANDTVKIYCWKSKWELSKDEKFQNVSGTIFVLTPYKEFWKGGLATKFSLSNRKEIIGAASITFNLREITLTVDGYVENLHDNMITINITTPVSKFRHIKCRFGLNEKRRNVVAEIRTPTTALGAEVLLDVKSLADFDVKLSIATPIENLRLAALYAKLNRNAVDMRGEWNNVTLGFTGISYMNDLKDFEYSCKIFTPLQDFEEHGFVIKFLKKDIFVLNLHFKFSHYNCGIKMNGKPKSLILKQLGEKIIELEAKYDKDFKPPKVVETDFADLEYDEYFAYNVEFVLDLLVWPTIEGMVDVEEILDYYFTVANIKLPQGLVDIQNNLYFPDYLNVINVLNAETPFEIAKHLKLIIEHNVDLNFQHLHEKVKCLITKSDLVSGIGIDVVYFKSADLIEQPEHNIKINLELPTNKTVDITGKMDLDDNMFKGSLKTIVGDKSLSMALAFESEENFLEVTANYGLEENMSPRHNSSIYIKQEFSGVDKSLTVKLELNKENAVNKLDADVAWQVGNDNVEIISNGKYLSTELQLKSFEYSFLLKNNDKPQLNIDMKFLNRNNLIMVYGIRAAKFDEVINAEIWTPMEHFKNVSLHGTMTPINNDQYRIDGVFYRDMVTYNLKGVVQIQNRYPINVRLQTKTLSGGSDGIIELNVKNKQNALEYQFDAKENGKIFKMYGTFSYHNLTGLEFSGQVESTEAEVNRISFKGSYKFPALDRTTASLSFETPWADMGVQKVNIWSQVDRRLDMGQISGGYKFDSYSGVGKCEWTWSPEEDMRLLIESNIDHPNENTSILFSEIKYVNPNKNFKDLGIGGKLNLSSLWYFETKASLNYESENDIKFGLLTHWPLVENDIYELVGRYQGNLISRQSQGLDVSVEGKYSAKKSKQSYLTHLIYRNTTDLYSMGQVEWNIAGKNSTIQAEVQMLRKMKARREISAKLITPKFENEATLNLFGTYDQLKDSYHYVNWTVNYPSTKKIADIDLTIQSFANLKGKLNCMTPFSKAPWIETVLKFSTNSENNYRFCRVDWPTDFVLIILNNTYARKANENKIDGKIQLEVPFNTRHYADIIYNLDQYQRKDNGNIKVTYNKKEILKGIYQRKEETYDKFKETTDISLENDFRSIGIHFVNSSEWRNEKSYLNVKHAEIFDLHNQTKFNLTWELYDSTSGSEKEFKLVAIHPNRTVILTTNYDKSSIYKINHRTKLELSDAAWIGYRIVFGKSNKNKNDARNLLAELSYPKRKLTVDGYYVTSADVFTSNMTFSWSAALNNNTKVVRTSLLWRIEPLSQNDRDNQTIIFSLGHELLEKDLLIKGNLYRGIKDIIKANVHIDYSYDPQNLIEVNALLTDLSSRNDYTKYAVKFVAYHKASQINAQYNGSANHSPLLFKIESNSLYQRDYFQEKVGAFLILLDLNQKEVAYTRKSPYRTVHLWLQPHLSYPVYGMNATFLNTPDDNNSGFVYVDIHNKIAKAYFNLTEDGVHNLHMLGYIPDSRHSYIDIWRNYEEVYIVDVTSYLNLNHSRQISGRLHWRPKIKSELKEKARNIKNALLNSFNEHIDFWTKSLYVEALSAISDVWQTSKEYNKDFINDLAQLSVLEEDLEDLREYLNRSYEANDFYIKSVVNFSLTILDEVAFRDQFDSLPAIFSEIRQVLGESGKALRQSIIQLIEMIKTNYNNILQTFNNFFHGQPLKYFTDLMEKGFEKYEKFVKEIHISFINQVEIMWNKFSNLISTYTKEILKRLEPYIFRAMSFIEKTAWDFSKEIFNYINERTNEMAESTYFNQVSSFAQDIENLYKDIKAHDSIENIKKYSNIAWKFIKEKYQKVIPFGTEISEIVMEIWEEIKELEKIRQVQFVISKFKEVSSKIEWLEEELEIRKYLNHLYALLRNKLQNIALNALEVTDMYREAKTKFFFDPEVGEIDLEQKLPISWHAFNETPQFQEIPELKLLRQLQNILTANNMSLLEHLYDWRSYLDPKKWLPQYYSRAYLIDTRFYITHDKRFVSVDVDTNGFNNCTYVLSHDFWNSTFTLTVDFSDVAKFNLLVKDYVFQIDLISDTLYFNGTSNPMLPITLEDLLVHKDSDVLSINLDGGFKFECNMKFDLCWFETSGRYFGKTAGLLGTMNNEPLDDFITPSNTIALSNDAFTGAWSTSSCSKKSVGKLLNNQTKELSETCRQLFSSLAYCSNIVDPEPFINICLELGYESYREDPKRAFHKKLCTSVLAYIEVCQRSKVPIRMPQQCVFCELTNGTSVAEGAFVEYHDNFASRSSDIVFLVEANTCNTFNNGNQSFGYMISALEEQLQRQKFINNRYAVVAYGSQRSPFNYPRIISYRNGVFVNNTDQLNDYLAHVTTLSKSEDSSNPKSDILQAILKASRLNFRPGISRTFISLSCSRCDIKQMRFDYSSILQYLIDEGVSLHILTNADINFDKSRKVRQYYGFDKQFVYSNRNPEGDSEMRPTLLISKSSLGVCTPLAIESGGSIFSIRKTMTERKNSMKRFANIFAKRVVQSSIPNGSQTCECVGHNNVLAYMVCTPSEDHNQGSSYGEIDSDFSDWDWQTEDYDLE